MRTAKAYLIGGAPRTGKSTLAQRFLEFEPMQSASTDAIRAQIRGTTTRSAEPDLYYLDSLNADEADMARLMRDHTADIIAAANRESAVVWRTIEPFIRANIQAGHNVLVEGVAVLPKFVTALDIPYSVVYLGNQSPEHAQIVHDYAQNHPGTWLSHLKPDTVSAFATFCGATSVHIEKEAKEYGQTYIEMSTHPFEKSLDLALKVFKT